MFTAALRPLALLLLIACGGGAGPGGSTDTNIPQTGVSSAFRVRGSLEQIHIWSAPEAASMEVLDAMGVVVATGTTDALGSLVLRALDPADALTVRIATDPGEATFPVVVRAVADSTPDQAFYDAQELGPGHPYITTRDGTTLATYIYLPGPIEEGPYPTIVNYSGYSPSQPGASLGPDVEPFCGLFPILCDAPSFPTGIFGGLMGYAVVGVNMRGTGCSGGAYDYFEDLQVTDGYDIIEAVAAQDWVAGNKVGMAGLSYPGISQLFVASSQPPSLAAITPLSVLADTTSSTLLPGGICNEGFALSWYDAVLSRAVPFGHDYITEVVENGDVVCAENQLLHSQALDRLTLVQEDPFYSDDLSLPVDPSAFVHKIDVPVYLSGQWQDEQTGPHFPALFDKFDNAPVVRFTATNGIHLDGLSAQNLVEWKLFLDLYVAEQVPTIPAGFESLAPAFMAAVFGDELPLPPNRFADHTDYARARADYEAEDEVRIIFESGTDPSVASGAPVGGFETHLPSWPPPDAVATRWYLHPDGSLLPNPAPAEGGESSWAHDPSAGLVSTLASGEVDPLQPDWDWPQPQTGTAISFLTPPLTEDMVIVGHGSVDLWIRSDATDADIEVGVSEVRPDGQESLVQHGWLRASHRALRDDATELRPVKTHREEDTAPLDPDDWTPLRVEVMPFGHAFRAGSQLRLTIDTPGGSMARWGFTLLDLPQDTTHRLAHDANLPSSIVLSVLPDVDVPTPLPPCEALRGQPCRTYIPL